MHSGQLANTIDCRIFIYKKINRSYYMYIYERQHFTIVFTIVSDSICYDAPVINKCTSNLINEDVS